MKRTRKARVVDAILISDLHLTDKTPVSRMDDYIEAQKRKLEFLKKLSKENNNCPILCAGDVFDHWKASPWLCSLAYKYLPEPFICIPGQHDLPGHSLGEFSKSGLGLLYAVGKARVFQNTSVFQTNNGLYVFGVPFGRLEDFNPGEIRLPSPGRTILMLHNLVWPDKRPSWSKYTYTADELLDRFKDNFDVILTGDNHQSFVRQKDGSILVNPGSMMRITADQVDHQPKCYLYYTETNTVKPINLPIQEGVISTEHIEQKREKDERIAAYIERMNQDWEISLSFRRNLEVFFEENNVPKKVREIIWKAMERINN